MKNDTHTLRFMPQLDSLRALSVLAVIYSHTLPKEYWLFGIYWAGWGVRCFFVLSGFLITSILLRDLNSTSLKSAYAAFLYRRALRLYPVLFVVVASAAAVGIEPVRETLLWHLSYLTNFYIVINGWPLVVSHLWSLAVEQQFYMIWPFVIFFLPRALLPSALILLIASSLAFRIVWRDMVGGVGADVLAPASFDALGMGALVAVWRDKKQRLIDLAAAVGLGVVLVSLVIVRVGSDVASTAVTWIFGWVISRAAVGFDGITGKVLNNAALRYIGTISYGIYVMHEVVPFFLIKGGLPVEPFGAAFRSIALGLTFLLAALSWHFMERPIMRVGRAGL